MPLPAASTAWPPQGQSPFLNDIAEWSAWYSGESDQLLDFYGSTTSLRPSAQARTAMPAGKVRFWQRRTEDPVAPKMRMHVPLAGDIAAGSADLLFGNMPDLQIRPADDPAQEDLDNVDDGGAGQAQDRLLGLAETMGLQNRLLEAAEVAAALGGIYLVPVWDNDLADHPLLAVHHPDRAIPTFRWGQLVAVTFFSVVHREGRQVWRHLERYERPGLIYNGLYVGTGDDLGDPHPQGLAGHPSTAGLEPEINLSAETPRLVEASGGLPVRYVPNVLPNRRRRGSWHGRADISGSEDVLDGLDQAYTSWMKDVRLGQRRIVASNTALQRGGRGTGAWFDVDREVFVGLDVVESTERPPLLEPVDFAIRAADHETTVMNWIERVISAAGYSPQTFGLHIEGRAESGTALRERKSKTNATVRRKRGYWGSPLADTASMLLAVDADVFGGPVRQVWRPNVVWPEQVDEDPKELAETAEMLARARAASTRSLVKMTQPGLSETQVDEEVGRILADEGRSVPDPLEVGLD